MVFKRFYLIFLLIMSLVISGCSGLGYVFDKVFYAGQFGKRVQVPTFSIFSFGFDATESGDIYFSLQTDSTLSICKINHDSDMIYVIQSGEITEKGTHPELIDKKGYYYQLYTKTLF